MEPGAAQLGLPVVIHTGGFPEAWTGAAKRGCLAVLKKGLAVKLFNSRLPRLDKLPRDSTCVRGHVVAAENSSSRDGQRQRGRKWTAQARGYLETKDVINRCIFKRKINL